MQCWNGFLVASSLTLVALGGPGIPASQDESSEEARETAVAEIDPSKEKRPKDAKSLFERFAQMEGLEVSFKEKKHLALLAVPLESSGKIYFLRPGYLTRVVEKPSPSKLTITPDELRMINREGEEVLDLRKNAELQTFVTSLVRVFSGDRTRLEKSYTIRYVLDPEDEKGWSLALEPRAKPLTNMMKRLRLTGRGVMVLTIEMHEPNGDRTLTTVEKVNARRRFTPEEKAELFGIEKKGA